MKTEKLLTTLFFGAAFLFAASQCLADETVPPVREWMQATVFLVNPSSSGHIEYGIGINECRISASEESLDKISHFVANQTVKLSMDSKLYPTTTQTAYMLDANGNEHMIKTSGGFCR